MLANHKSCYEWPSVEMQLVQGNYLMVYPLCNLNLKGIKFNLDKVVNKLLMLVYSPGCGLVVGREILMGLSTEIHLMCSQTKNQHL